MFRNETVTCSVLKHNSPVDFYFNECIKLITFILQIMAPLLPIIKKKKAIIIK